MIKKQKFIQPTIAFVDLECVDILIKSENGKNWDRGEWVPIG